MVDHAPTCGEGRERHATHRGIEECRAFAERFVAEGLHIEIEDIVVNGMPWNLRVAVRATDHLAGPDGDEYNNRLVAWLEIRWGRLVSWEDYEDSERVAAWDRRPGTDGESPTWVMPHPPQSDTVSA